MSSGPKVYRGRLAPTPSGFLHVGHARTFQVAWSRAREKNGRLVFRVEDIDRERCREEFEQAAYEDLAWLGLDWDEGGAAVGEFGPYRQSERLGRHREIWQRLIQGGWIYPCRFSRREIHLHNPEREWDGSLRFPSNLRREASSAERLSPDPMVNWRFRVPDGEAIEFVDENIGPKRFVAGEDFGDFLVWRKAGGPAYELAVVADDADMAISEVVRGEDLLLSTARQILVFRALGYPIPGYFHAPLVRDENGERLSKTARSVTIRELRDKGWSPRDVLRWQPTLSG